MKIEAVIKPIVDLMITVGVGALVAEGGKQLTPSNPSKFTRLCILVSLGAITGLISLAAVNYANTEIDETVKLVGELKDSIDEIKSLKLKMENQNEQQS